MADQVYIGLGDETDPTTIAEDAYEYIQSYFPEWEPSEGNLETILIQTQAQEQSIERALAAETADEIFRYFGDLVGITPDDPTSATGTSTWTMIDDSGYTIPAGTQVSIVGLDGESVGFQVVEDVEVPGGSTETAAGEVQLEAIETGTAGNDLAGDIELVDQLAYVTSAVLVDTTSGGSDGETDYEYLKRLTELLRLQAPRPILPDDFAVMARTLVTGVHRATAIDLYNAESEETDVPRCLTVAVVDENGDACSTEIKTAVDDLLQSYREVNFLVFVIDPTYTEIDCWFTISIKDDYDQTEVESSAISAVEDYLSPANWGLPDTTGSDTTTWVNSSTVRINELISLIDQVEGVDYVEQVWLAESGDPADTVNITLTGPAPLTQAGTVLAEEPA